MTENTRDSLSGLLSPAALVARLRADVDGEETTQRISLMDISATIDELECALDGPSRKMVDAGMAAAKFQYGHGVTRSSVESIFKAMVSA